MTAATLLRAACYLDLSILFGVPLFAVYGPGELRCADPLRCSRWMAGAAAAGLVLVPAAMVTAVAAMAGVPVAELPPALALEVVRSSATGIAFCVRLATLVLVLLISFVPRLSSDRRAIAGAGAGGVALASLAWTGHGAMDDGAAGWAHLVADIAHLLAAGVWIGALAALLVLTARDLARQDNRALAVRALHRFAPVGTAAVAVLVVSGAANAWVLLLRDGGSLLPLNEYRLLLTFKLAAFCGMLALAALNRWRLTAAIMRGGRAIRASLTLETMLAMAILLLVAGLGVLSPSGG